MNLSDLYRLLRAGIYTNPLNEAAELPIVYGDLTYGSSGNWIAPCIDTIQFIYCFAAHEVLSVANGNSISVYKDDVLVSSGYTFDESNNVESKGAIATITFTSSQGNAVISCKGKGRANGSSLIENIIDQIYDFFITLNGFDSTEFDDSTKAKSKTIFNNQGYKAAGVINKDLTYFSILSTMLNSFLGRAYRNFNKKIVILIDDNNYNQYIQSDRITKGSVEVIYAERFRSDIINRCPIKYAYNYVNNIYKRELNADSHINKSSQTKYGERLPRTGSFNLSWCYDSTSASIIQNLIIEKYNEPPFKITVEDNSLERCLLESDDLFSLTIDWLYNRDIETLVNELWRVLNLKNNLDAGDGRLQYVCEDTKAFLTTAYLADGTYEAEGSVIAGGKRDTTEY